MSKFIVAIGIILGGFATLAAAQMSDGTPRSSDEMLQYTLSELKTRLQDVVRENNKLSNRNNALRKRMLSLRQDMRELENHKLNLMERNNDLRDFLKLDSQEAAIVRKKIKDIEEQDSLSGNMGGALLKAVEQDEARKEKLQGTIVKIQADINDIHDLRANKKVSQARNNDQEKSELAAQIQRVIARNRSLEKELPAARKKLADVTERKNTFLARQAALESQVRDFESTLSEAASQEEKISGHVRKVSQSQDKATRQLNDQIGHLTLRREQMVGALADAQAIRRRVQEDVAVQEAEINRVSILLANERQALQEQKRILQTRLRHADISAGGDQPEVQEKINALTQEIAPLKAEGQELKAKIAQQEQQSVELKTKETLLQRDMVQLKQDMQKTEQRGRQSQTYTLKSRKANLTKLLNDYQARTQSLKKQILDRQKQKDLSEQKITTWKSRQAQLNEALKAGAEELAGAQEEEKALRQAAKDLEGRRGQGSEALKQEIDTLDLRQAVLMSSLDAIRNKYNQDKDSIREFVSQDQKELEDYLEVLKAENVTLRDKALSLSRSMRQKEGK